MGDSEKPKPKGIPSWQLQENTDTSTAAEQASSQEAEEGSLPSNRAALLEKAANFLEEDGIRDAPIKRKQYFLKLKGLTDDEIEDLVGRQHTTEGEIAEGYQEEQQQASESMSAPDPDPPREQSSTSPAKEVPPIITYPEFLMHSQKPPPLITSQRLLTTLYLASGAAATIYGTNRYLIEPMVASLSSARHSLFETASSNLATLNKRLEEAASKFPENSFKSGDSDIGSEESDPARFSTRSAATQTSPNLSGSSSLASSDQLGPGSSPIQLQEAALSDIHDRLDDLRAEDPQAPNPLKDNLDELRTYLEGLAYNRNQTRDMWNQDPVTKVKAEITSMKGLLLSARNFPSGVSLR